jgi:hypothetical protein
MVTDLPSSSVSQRGESQAVPHGMRQEGRGNPVGTHSGTACWPSGRVEV